MCCEAANGLTGEKKVGLRGVTGGDSGPVVVDVVLECVSPSDAPLQLGGASFSLVERDSVDSTSKDQKARDYKGP